MRKRCLMVMLMIIPALGGLSSCAKPSREMRMVVQECEKIDQVASVKKKNPALAAALGLVFGGGSFYTRQYELGLLDALTWPLSILWDPFIGHLGAKRINDEATVDACRQLRWQKRQASAPVAPAPLPPAP